MEALPSVVKSPTNSTLGFLCRFGSALNSLVTKFSRSLAFEPKRNVRPFTTVSSGPFGVTGVVLLAGCKGGGACVCRTMKVKLKMRSSSFGKRRRKVGGAEDVVVSGS